MLDEQSRWNKDYGFIACGQIDRQTHEARRN